MYDWLSNNTRDFMRDGDHVNANGAFKVAQELNKLELSN